MCGGPPPTRNPPPTNRPVLITLTVVNPSVLYNLDPQPTTQAELDPYCSLTDDNTPPGKIVPPGGTINDFTSQVYSGNTVTWAAANIANEGFTAAITGVTPNSNFFAIEPHGSSGRITATLKTDINGVEDTYTVNFSLTPIPPGNNPVVKTYGLDPKLEGNN